MAGRFRINDLRAAWNQLGGKRPARLLREVASIQPASGARAFVGEALCQTSQPSAITQSSIMPVSDEWLLTFARCYSESQSRTGPNPRVRLASIDRVLARVPFRS